MNTLYSCHEHIEVMLDDFVDQFEQAPEMEKLSKSDAVIGCHFCQNPAQYTLYSEYETKD